MILNHDQIIRRVNRNEIEIPGFDPAKVGANSYDVTLNEWLMVYTAKVLDCKTDNETSRVHISELGYELKPGRLYLGSINEDIYNHCSDVVPQLEGRSSVARLGIGIHVCAGFGDVGFSGKWTLEITCVQPVRIYPNMPIGQIYWLTCEESRVRYAGKYRANEMSASRLHQEFSGEKGQQTK